MVSASRDHQTVADGVGETSEHLFMEINGITIETKQVGHQTLYTFTVGPKNFSKIFESTEEPERISAVISQAIVQAKVNLTV